MQATLCFLYTLIAIAFTGAYAVYEDCERPPQVEHANYEIDEADEIYKAIYTCQTGYELKGASELICNLDTDEWNGEPPTCIGEAVHSERKKKVLALTEELKVSEEMAEILDTSCIAAKVQAPVISHGVVTKYERRRRGEKVFLVAYYGCNTNYEFEDASATALYCRAKTWVGEIPTCVAQGDYTEEGDGDGGDEGEDEEGEEYDEYETVQEEREGETNDVEGEDENGEEQEPVAPQPPPPPVEVQPEPQPEPEPEPEPEPQPTPEAEPQPEEQTESEPEIIVRVEDDKEDSEDLEKPIETVTPTPTATDINIVVDPTQDPYTPRKLDENCGEDRGGCAHKCERLLFPGENEPRIKCTCYEGFTLDPNDYANCHDIDECQESNGGCSQICNNLPGSFECSCEKGYQIDTLTGNTCVDIDECAQAEVAAQCEHGCENLPGSYRCVVPEPQPETEEEEEEENNEIEVEPKIVRVDEQLVCGSGFRLAEDGSKCLDIDECSEGLHGGCEQCLNLEGGFQCNCPAGFELAANGKSCQDIDECGIIVDKEADDEHVPHRLCQQQCENTLGSYRCSCSRGYHLLEDQSSCAPDNCQDLDNPQLNRTRCAHHCVNLPDGRYECVCPKGYKLAEDLHSCVVLETACALAEGHQRCRPGTCQPNEDNTSFSCLCPPGYTDEVYSCKDIDECELGSHKCSHNCLNTEGGYQCLCPVGMRLAENERTCLAHDPCGPNNNGCEQLCLSSQGGLCGCREGYQLSQDGKSCLDVDECLAKNGGCQQLCRNLPGSHACACDTGYQLAADGHTCEDVDECAAPTAGGCTHECINRPGGYDCACPLGYILQEDSQSCRPILVGCPPGSRRTAEGCAPIECGAGLILGADGTCVDIDECQLNNGGCSHLCQNVPGGFECTCPGDLTLVEGKRCVAKCGVGFRQSLIDPATCLDMDECAQPGICQQKCENTQGSYKCLCAAGFTLAPNNRDCLALPQVEPEVRDQCPKFQAPVNGQARCNKYRHKKKRFYNTRCRVWCNKGYNLIGSEIRTCGASGNWDGHENKCEPAFTRRHFTQLGSGLVPQNNRPAACPPLKPPQNGVILPASCTQGPSGFGAACNLRCHPGFVPASSMLTSCSPAFGWSLGSTLECKPFGLPILGNQIPNQLSAPWMPLPGVPQPGFPLPVAPQTIQRQIARPPLNLQARSQSLRAAPYLKCPHDAVILLKPGQTQAHVVLQQPITNLDYRHIEVQPSWASQQQAHLHAGVHEVSYLGLDPATGQRVNCKTVITIKAAEDTQQPAQQNQAQLVTGSSQGGFCTPSFEVSLKENQHLRSVAWEEPRFEGKLVNVYKSHFPGALFGLGDHTIIYEATLANGLTLRCNFKIHVKAAAPTAPPTHARISYPDLSASLLPKPNSPAAQQTTHSNLLGGHESYVVCPNQEPIKVTSSQSVNLPVGCSLRNVRKHTQSPGHFKRGLLTSLWRPVTHF